MKTFVKKRKTILILGLIILFASFIRIYKVDKNPASLFGDELDVGYQAYSILKTGKDYTGHTMPLQFQSFTEHRAPLYLYATVPTVAIFGISPLGVRLPAIIFGILGVFGIYLLTKEITKDKNMGLVASFVIAVSPWHIHYSRAGFEATLLFTLFILGLFCFLRGLEKPIFFIPSVVFLVFTPWVYSTAQLNLPLTGLFLLAFWLKELFVKKNYKYLIVSTIIFLTIFIPYAWSTYFGGGTERFSTLSIFTNPVMEGTVGEARLEDMIMSPLTSKPGFDRLFHNKYIFILKQFKTNYLKSFSTDFLFILGDGNPRHNSSGMGQLYLIEIVLLLIGLYHFYIRKINKKKKVLVIFLLLTSTIPSSLTVDGGNHATRLILLLIPLIIIVSCGIYGLYETVSANQKRWFIAVVGFLYIVNFISYQHFYWIHFPLATEKQWGYGWEEVIKGAISYSKEYEKVVISSYNAPALLNYLAFDMYPPDKFQKVKDDNYVDVGGFGLSRQIGNIYFPVENKGYNLYNVSSAMDKSTLYIASMEEFKLDLVKEPKRIPLDLSLVKTVKYLSGEPAFYFITKK